jgi:hypothetical protein
MIAISPRLHAAAASFWREWHRELRRHAGDERLPYSIRARLRTAADRALERAANDEQHAVVPRWNRRAIAAAVRHTRLDRPVVAVESGLRADRFAKAARLLAREGFEVVPVGASGAVTLADRDVLRMSAFLVCLTAELQHAAYETQTPTLRLDARDPFTAYPIRPDGVFTLATVVDLDTGRILAREELLTEQYFHNRRNCGYRGADAAEIAEAVAEMIEGVRGGWTDSAAQMRFRRAVVDAGVSIGARVRHLVEWDAAGGFVGDGRLARAQAERAL